MTGWSAGVRDLSGKTHCQSKEEKLLFDFKRIHLDSNFISVLYFPQRYNHKLQHDLYGA